MGAWLILWTRALPALRALPMRSPAPLLRPDTLTYTRSSTTANMRCAWESEARRCALWVVCGHGRRECGQGASSACAWLPSRGPSKSVPFCAIWLPGPVRRLVACFAMPASPTRKENVKSPAEGRQELVESFQGMCGRPPEPKGRPRSGGRSAGCAAEAV